MSGKKVVVHARWVVGKVIGTKMRKTAKVRVTRLVLDSYLLKVNPQLMYVDDSCVRKTTMCLCNTRTLNLKHIN